MLKSGELEGRLILPLTSEMQQTLEDVIRFTCKPNSSIPTAGVLDPDSFTAKQQAVEE